jgi:hypothetical protein
VPPVSLIATAAQLGKTSGPIRLSELRTNGYTRTHAGSGYRAVNPFQVEQGHADDPSRIDTRHYLGNWVDYLQSGLNTGSELTVASGYGEVTLTWTRPAGWSRASALLSQWIYMKRTEQTEVDSTARGVNPFDTPDSVVSLGAGSSANVSASAFVGEVIAVGVKVEFDDTVAVHTNPDNQAYEPAVGQLSLTGVARGIALLVYDTQPVITNVAQTPESAVCIEGSDVEVRVFFTMLGPSLGTLQESVNGGAWSNISTTVAAESPSYALTRAGDSVTELRFRIKYNDVPGDLWSNIAVFTPSCDIR